MSTKPATLSNSVLIPASAVLTAITLTVGVCRWAFGASAQTQQDSAILKVEVTNLDGRVTRAEARLDKSDERWDQIKDDLAKIKERLGIVEATKQVK